MRPMMRLVLGVIVLVAILVGVAFALPSQVTVARSVVINAPEAVVFPYLNNLHRFGDWSPWAERDRDLRVSYSGPEEGKGAHTDWTSEKQSIGTGSMEITGSDPNRHVDLVVKFNGMDGTSYYEIGPSGSGSKVSWGFGYDAGTSPFGRWKGLMLDRIVGAEYHDGLTKLKEHIEAERAPTAPTAPTAAPPVAQAAPVPVPAEPPAATADQSTAVPESVVPQSTSSTPPVPPVAEPAPAPKPAKKPTKRRPSF
jgi:hypothetical protein